MMLHPYFFRFSSDQYNFEEMWKKES